MRFGIDYAWGQVDVRALRRAHVAFVGRYLSFDASKNIHAAEYRQLERAGIQVLTFWETTADRARAGAGAGRSDAINADAQQRRCGMPATQIVYLAVDFAAEGPEVHDYFATAREVLGDRTGAYGGRRVIAYLFDHGLISDAVQTYAWSAGQWDRRALIRQYSNGHELAGVSCDYLAALDPPKPANFVPADEARWRREYDQLGARRDPWAVMRRRVLRRYMHRRELAILEAVGPGHQEHAWELNNRTARYLELRRRGA